jgi:hypothetical protein
VTALIRGDLSGCHPGMATAAARQRRTRQKSAEAIVPAGWRKPGRAEHQASQSRVWLATETMIAAIPRNVGLAGE